MPDASPRAVVTGFVGATEKGSPTEGWVVCDSGAYLRSLLMKGGIACDVIPVIVSKGQPV